MSQHTTGPWITISGGAPNRPIEIISKGLNVATVKGAKAYNVPEAYSERIANARLIAAAPELLEAAHMALKLIRGSGFTDNTQALIALREAIAKAEGK